jgi:hypothetical protein
MFKEWHFAYVADWSGVALLFLFRERESAPNSDKDDLF